MVRWMFMDLFYHMTVVWPSELVGEQVAIPPPLMVIVELVW